MSRHEGVSCDACMKNNFRGRRYKCLACYDYDLCAQCYDNGVSGSNHTADHPMQCILTRTDFELYYGGEVLPETHHPQAFTCPFCTRLGFTETTLQEHVSVDHAESAVEVLCPVCAALPGGEPNHMTDDLAAHLALDHSPSRRASNSQEEPRPARRAPATTTAVLRGGLSGATARTRRSNLSAGLAALSSREAIDPIAELLSQLGGLRRGGPSAAAQIQQLQQVVARGTAGARRTLVATTLEPSALGGSAAIVQNGVGTVLGSGTVPVEQPLAVPVVVVAATSATTDQDSHRYMLPSVLDTGLSEVEQEALECEQADRSVFVQQLLMSTMVPHNTASSADQGVSKRSEHKIARESGPTVTVTTTPASFINTQRGGISTTSTTMPLVSRVTVTSTASMTGASPTAAAAQGEPTSTSDLTHAPGRPITVRIPTGNRTSNTQPTPTEQAVRPRPREPVAGNISSGHIANV